MKKNIVILFLVLASIPGFAQKLVQVESEYSYVVPENTSIEQAKLTALDRARLQAIADEFGTLVNQSNTIYVENQNGVSNLHFQSLGSSNVKGEWVETIGEPVYEIAFEQNMLVVKVKVRGRIKESLSSEIPLTVQVLCNGTATKHERYDFKNGDDMFLRFQSPVNGYLIIYLIDHSSGNAYCLLPYSQSADAAQRIVHDKEYVFFSIEDAPDGNKEEVDEYSMTCSGGIERNDIYVIFSPNEFTKANSSQLDISRPRELSISNFNEWLSGIRIKEPGAQCISKSITISNL